ncbi:transcriptional regulator, LysR family [Noviherbaspirillum humi]|uniref:Transcriptional regulator, LysR family n=1 Tax=Noviherbaspirillum humi TaxID=1688639 RepID=A0A239KZZ5_9BURK|nr:LysR family transcriptional regulator [Noviherbaspirillum humi]SNT23896.1 transcriptional regulator, LysR family [Noviherbaspirillum humi]
MNSDDLESFVRVAQCGSISRAAMELGSDQSTISRQMARLEADSAARLFHRSGRGVVLTDAGMALLAQAREVLAALEKARQVVHTLSDQGPARVVIAAQPTIARMTFGPVGRALKKQFPKTRLRFVEGLGSHMMEWLAAGEVDIALLYVPMHAANSLKVDMLLREPIRLVAPASFAHIGAEFPVRQLGEVPLVLPSTPHGLRLLAESLAQKTGVTLDIAMECDASTNVTHRLVEEGCGCTLLPLASVKNEVAQGRLRTARLTGPEVVREVAMATARNRPPVSQLWGVMQTIRHEVIQIVADGHWPDAQPAE